MAQAPKNLEKRQKVFHADSQQQRLKLVKASLNEHTPLATVLQEVVVEFLKGAATTLFVSDNNKSVVLAVDLENKNAVHVLGGMFAKQGHVDGRGSEARFTLPGSLAVDPASGALLMCDLSCIRRIASDGTVSTLCGHPKEEGYREGVGSAALFARHMGGCAVIGKDLFVCDTWNHCIRRIPLDGSSTSLFAGSPGQPGYVDGVGAEAAFDRPEGLCRDIAGNLIVADQRNNFIRKITSAGVVTTLAGSGWKGSQDGPAKEASFTCPNCVVFDAERNRVLVGECSNHEVDRVTRSIDLCTNQVSTLPLKIVPHSIAVDCTGNIFMSSSNAVLKVSPNCQVDIIFGRGVRNFFNIAALL